MAYKQMDNTIPLQQIKYTLNFCPNWQNLDIECVHPQCWFNTSPPTSAITTITEKGANAAATRTSAQKNIKYVNFGGSHLSDGLMHLLSKIYHQLKRCCIPLAMPNVFSRSNNSQ
jgi:hypothetical protein